MENQRIFQSISAIVKECLLTRTSSKVEVDIWCKRHAIDYDRDIELLRYAAIQIEHDSLGVVV